MSTPTSIACRGCSAVITAKRNGQTTIWLEANGRKHNCPNAGNFAPASPDETTNGTFDLQSVYDALEELDAEAKLAEESKPTPIAPKVRFVNGQVPSLDGDYLIDSVHLSAIRRVIALAESGEPQNMGFYGPAGSGKTTLGVQIGALRGSTTFVIDSTDKQTADEWFGTQTIDQGVLLTHESDFVKAIETPNAVVVLDDVALLQNRTVQNGLNAILDPTRRSIFVQQLGRIISVADGVIIVGTWNVGDEYVAERLSAQIVDRFRSGVMFELPYPDDGALEHVLKARTGISPKGAAALTKMVEWLRGNPATKDMLVSTRGLIAAAKHIVHGATYGEAVAFTVFSELDPNELAKAFQAIQAKANADVPGQSKAAVAERKQWDIPVRGQAMVRLS